MTGVDAPKMACGISIEGRAQDSVSSHKGSTEPMARVADILSVARYQFSFSHGVQGQAALLLRGRAINALERNQESLLMNHVFLNSTSLTRVK